MKNFKRTHHGKIYGIPVYLDMTDPECPGIEPKYKLGFLLSIAEAFFMSYCAVKSLFDLEFEPMFPILVGEEIKQDRE